MNKKIITVVTAHQLTADTIATAIGATEKHDGYYLGNGYAVTWTNGGVIEARFKSSERFILNSGMDPKLILAHNFEFVMRDYDALVGYNKSEHDTKQLATIKALWKMSHTVINAMNPDFEGELNFLSLYYFLATPVEVRRAWLPILTKPAILKAMENGPENPAMYKEWLEREIYNHLVCFCEEDADFKTTPVFVEVPVATAAQEVKELRYVGLDAASEGSVTITPMAIYTYTEKPTLHNLPQLLIDAAVQLDYSHEKTIKTALNLWAKKLISYPMVRQNYIPVEIWREMIRNRETLRFNSKWGKHMRGKAVSGRHNFDGCMNPYYGFGIVTTGLHPTDLTREEENLYNLIVKRVLEAFTPGRALRNRKDKERRRRRGQNRRRKYSDKTV